MTASEQGSLLLSSSISIVKKSSRVLGFIHQSHGLSHPRFSSTYWKIHQGNGEAFWAGQSFFTSSVLTTLKEKEENHAVLIPTVPIPVMPNGRLHSSQ